MRLLISRIIGLLCLSLLLQLPAQAQVEISWEQLEDMSYSIKNSDVNDLGWGKPKFGESLKALDGKRVKISGYMLPLTVDRKEYILSKYHFSECFFCGNGGLETVIELKLKQEIRKVVIDHPVSLTGIFRLNKNPYELVFVLEEAEGE